MPAFLASLKVQTPSGHRKLSQLRVGDQVLGRDGRPCLVTVVGPAEQRQDLLKITYLDFGSTPSGEHRRDETVIVSPDAKLLLRASPRTAPALAKDGRVDATARSVNFNLRCDGRDHVNGLEALVGVEQDGLSAEAAEHAKAVQRRLVAMAVNVEPPSSVGDAMHVDESVGEADAVDLEIDMQDLAASGAVELGAAFFQHAGSGPDPALGLPPAPTSFVHGPDLLSSDPADEAYAPKTSGASTLSAMSIDDLHAEDALERYGEDLLQIMQIVAVRLSAAANDAVERKGVGIGRKGRAPSKACSCGLFKSVRLNFDDEPMAQLALTLLESDLAHLIAPNLIRPGDEFTMTAAQWQACSHSKELKCAKLLQYEPPPSAVANAADADSIPLVDGVDPWFVGLRLGDGDAASMAYTAAVSDEQSRRRVLSMLDDMNTTRPAGATPYSITSTCSSRAGEWSEGLQTYHTEDCMHHAIVQVPRSPVKWNPLGEAWALWDMKTSKANGFPAAILNGSERVQARALAGLIDSDGWLDHAHNRYGVAQSIEAYSDNHLKCAGKDALSCRLTIAQHRQARPAW